MESDLLIIAAQTDELRDRLESLPGYNLSSVKDGAVSVMSQMQIGSAEFQDHRRMIAGALAFSGVTIDAGRADAVVECR